MEETKIVVARMDASSENDTLLPPDTTKWPKSIAFIMGNEACERFSFYGLKAILALYLHKYLLFSEDTSTMIIHAFIFGAYSCALFGGYISDSFLGKFKTILYLSFVYVAGSIVLSVTSIPGATGDPPHWWGAAVGLTLVSLGTGGIKPCVSSFVGDQFVKGQEAMLGMVFAMFYFCINAGSLASTIITPLLREHTTYYIAFGVPAALLTLATIVFWAGLPTYRIVPPGANMTNILFGALAAGFRGKFRSGGPKKGFWEHAEDKYDRQTISDIKAALGVYRVFIPLPVFWSLFDQHASRWVFQADLMDREIFGLTIQPDQVPTLNPLIMLTLIPIFNKVVYPGLEKIGIRLRPLMRMSIGMLFISLSFVVAGFIELWLEEDHLFIAWQIPQYFLLGCGEIMVSITGLEFAYSQAPQSMKSVVMAGWLLTTAVGNAIVAVIAESKIFSERWIEFFFFAGLMVVFIAIFIGFTFNYRYVEDAAAAADDGLAGLGGQSDGDSFHQDGKRKSSSSNKKEERRRLMRDDRFEEGVVIDHEDPYPTLHRGNHSSKRDTSGYDQLDA